MKKIIKIIAALFILITLFSLSGCRKEDSIQHNLLKQTANFQTYRKITVINLRSDKVLMEFEGYLTSKLDSEGDVNIMIMTGPNQYKLHYVRLANEICYLSEQIENSYTDPYHWEIRIYAIIPDIQIG